MQCIYIILQHGVLFRLYFHLWYENYPVESNVLALSYIREMHNDVLLAYLQNSKTLLIYIEYMFSYSQCLLQVHGNSHFASYYGGLSTGTFHEIIQ